MSVIIWVNGAFGAGKTTLTRELLDRHPEFLGFDPESVGELLQQGFAATGHDVFQVVLDADEDTLSARIAVSGEAVNWRQERRADYLSAREWLRNEADLVLDTTAASPTELAMPVEAALSEKAAQRRNTADMRKAPRWREQRGRSYTPRDLNPEPTD